jgi:uncharacterized membrane protein
MTMQRIGRYFSWFIVTLYFFIGIWVLVSDRFDYMLKELRIIFAVFLFLYGGFRLARLWSRRRERDPD